MEELRKRLAGDNMLYPQLNNLKAKDNGRPVQARTEIISVGSDTSSVDVPGPKPRANARVIVLTDSEDEEVTPTPQPLQPRAPNQREFAPTKPSVPKPLKPTAPAHMIPTHPAAADDGEEFNFAGMAAYEGPQFTAKDTQEALRELVAGTQGYDDLDVSEEDAHVEGLKFELLPHQVVGRKWMADRESGKKKTGGILADDMGLGKTIQAITRIVEGRPSKKDRDEGWAACTLVVCPVAVISQWAQEIKKFAPGLKVIEHHGQNRSADPSQLERAHVVIASYPTVASEHGVYAGGAKDESKSKKKKKADDEDNEDDSSDEDIADVIKRRRAASKKKGKDTLFRVQWWRVILDEAHNIKNRATKAADACCALEAKFRWCLTGTPMQNSVEELYSLIKFLRIKPLNDWANFNEHIAKPIKAGRVATPMKRLHCVLSAIMLRRTKDTQLHGKPLLNLPARKVRVVNCEFDRSERAFYESINERVQQSLEKLQKSGEMSKSYTSILVLLLRMRQACNHPALVSQDYKKDSEAMEPKVTKENEDEDDADDLAAVLAGMGLSQGKKCQVCMNEIPANVDGNTCEDCEDLVASTKGSSDLPPDSAKTRKLLEILEEIDESSDGTEKTIVFSQFTSMLDLVEPFLRDRGIRFVRYDGTMDKKQRDYSLDKIKTSKSTRVILISFKAGSTGLNLTCCNHVVLIDLWWNPALEDQAFDRAHRLGQTREVDIRKLCVPDTVEQRILELQDKKRDLAKAALSGVKLKSMRLGVDELVALFRPGHDDD